MQNVGQVISQIVNLFQWWIVIAPWELAIRVRRGKKISVLQPGLHFRIPGLDRFFVQSTRKRYMNTPTQTVTTLDGKTVTVSGGTAYSIKDITTLYDTLSDPEDVIQIETMALVAQYVAMNTFEKTTPINVQEYVNLNLHLDQYGLGNATFRITDFVAVKTYRIITTNPKDWGANQVLNTNQEKVMS